MKPSRHKKITSAPTPPQPREITLGILRQFARCCKADKRLAMPIRIINPN
ncbi:MAG: hypothetical protein K2I18_09580 [Paramuribaculum sp.]|nr:hypothetical protein [Paramuribaculum sp.]